MKLVVTEKNIAAKKLAEILAIGKPKSDKVYTTPVYRFARDGEDWVAIGLKGHIQEVKFPEMLIFDGAWRGVREGEPTVTAHLPEGLATPPWEQRRKPFTSDGVDLASWKLLALPYLVWAPVQKVDAEKEIIRSLRKLAKEADEIVIATDYDREGELIGSDARNIVREVNKRASIHRARFSAITKEEISRAFDGLAEVDDRLAEAGGSRQDIDLIWGAVLTRYLTAVKYSGYGNVRSAGRVQTPTLALVVEREREREAFVPETYWQIKAQFAAGATEFGATHATDRFKDEVAAKRAMAAIEGATHGSVTGIERKTRKVNPPTPFNTTELQAAASREGLSPARTMRVAESLYMNGFISYPRVDNTVYPASLDLRGILSTLAGVPAYAPFARDLLAGGALHATRGSKETTDHPPIHPTGAGDPDKMKPEEWKLYNLVARRFMATLSGAATIEGTKVEIAVNSEPFVAKGDVLVDAGFRAIYPYGLKKDEQLPALVAGDTVEVRSAELLEKQTEPTARYSQGTLIQEMEKRGLGTKATRHSIIERLLTVSYLEEQGSALAPTTRGRTVIDLLTEYAPRITTPDMTAELEAEMDGIATGATGRPAVVGHSRELLARIIDGLLAHSEEVGERLASATAADARIGACPKCGKDLLIKASPRTRGQFVGCSGWPECDVTYPLPQGRVEENPEPCATCGGLQVNVSQPRSKPRTLCLDPQCPTNQEPEVVVGTCLACEAAGKEGKLVVRRSARTLKRFVRCTNYEECQTSYPLPQSGEITPTEDRCKDCSAPMVTVQTRRGPWTICIDPNCPGREEKPQRTGARGTRARKK